MSGVSEDILSRFAAIAGEAQAIRDPHSKEAYLHEWRGLWHGQTPMVLRPSNTEQVSRIMALATETRTVMVPQSGNTGLVGGQIPDRSNTQIVLSLDRMTRVIEANAPNNSLTVEAGVTLKAAQDAADAIDRLFPLSLASEGSCRIGGNLSTNAGGLNTLAFGNARELCLGLEVVLADGRVWNGLKSLRKDNTGYDLRNIFIGAEGTLGIITAAVLKLFPKPKSHSTCFAGITSPAAAVELLSLAREASGNRLVAFELIPRLAIDFTVKHMCVRDPLAEPYPYYVLSELADADRASIDSLWNQAFERKLVQDAAVAQSESQRQAFWQIRELLSESQKFEGGSIKNDVSVPVAQVPALYEQATAAVLKVMPGVRFMAFGHMGDGNIHFNLSQPVGMDKQAFLDRWQDLSGAVSDVVLKLGGSISAEHGIGVLKRNDMLRIKSPAELQMMRGLKQLFDPLNILNPGKVLPE
ncbi:MAG: FAD-binding oxidoreductase [Rhizobiales bacterium]|nr:FAD-binding oxidoreductase [Hyphomicrobiales bacterium]